MIDCLSGSVTLRRVNDSPGCSSTNLATRSGHVEEGRQRGGWLIAAAGSKVSVFQMRRTWIGCQRRDEGA